MKRIFTHCTAFAFALALAGQSAQAEDWSYDFNDTESVVGTAHKDWAGEFNGLKWTSYAMRSGNESNDFKNDGTSVRIYGEKMSMKKMPFLEMAEDKAGGIGTISFSYRAYGTHEDSQTDWIVQVSKDAGEHWTTVGEPFRPSSEVQTFTVNANYPEGRMRIVRADYITFDPSTIRSFKAAFNIDDLSITDKKGGVVDIPEILPDQLSLKFEEIYKGSEATLTCSFAYQHLTDPVQVAFKEQTNDFRLSTSEIALDETGKAAFEVTYCPTTAGNHMAQITLTSGETSAMVIVQGTALRKPGEYTFSGGTGTEDDPYLISASGDLVELSEAVDVDLTTFEGKYFKMTDDVDFSAIKAFVPIGNNHGSNAVQRPFMGVFDGDNHTVSNLNISYSGINNMGVGLFGLTQNAIIKNITITNSSFKADAAPGSLVGVANGGEIINCHAGEGVSVTASNYYAGGLVGAILTEPTLIADCSSKADVTNSGMVAGGILGGSSANKTQVTRCINYGTIYAADQCGGVVGYCESGITISDCANVGGVSTSGQVAGGIIASVYPYMLGTLYILDCYNCALISGYKTVMPITIEKVEVSQSIEVSNTYYCSEYFQEDCTFGSPLSYDEMLDGTLLDKLNHSREPSVWSQDESINDGLPIPVSKEGDVTSVSRIKNEADAPFAAIENNRLRLSEGYKAVRICDTQGRTYSASAFLPSGIYIVVLSHNAEPARQHVVKVANTGF